MRPGTLKVVPFVAGSRNDRTALIRPGRESNPYRIGGMTGMATWGSRWRDNPRLREVSPTGKLRGGRGGCWCERCDFATESPDRSFR